MKIRAPYYIHCEDKSETFIYVLISKELSNNYVGLDQTDE